MSFAENAVIAKTRVVFGKSLKSDDYVQLAAKESVADVCAYLKQTERYKTALANVNPQTVHRGQLEQVIRRSMFDIFERFYNFDHSESRAFFDFIIMELEIEQLLAALQSVASGATVEFIAALPMLLTKHSRIDFAALGLAKNFAEVAVLLQGTPYYEIVHTALVEAESTGDLNICNIEQKLYTWYYMNMLKSANKIRSKREKTELKRLILGVIDMRNAVTVYRYTRLFGAGTDSAKNALIPFKRRLSDETIERLAQLDDIAKIAEELDAIGYGLHSQSVPATFELLTERISLDHLKKQFRLSQNPSVVYFAFMELLSVEFKNVKTIIEGVRYNLDGSAILEMLVI